ncbi:MAG: acyltransferase [Paludibacteraceae bacterium]|nr:acyltransferase [Paludibacteraceae bacterium]
MTSSDSSTWVIAQAKKIPYGHPHQPLRQRIHKVRNTILWNWAYRCPLNGLRVLFHRMRGVHIGKGVYIGRYCFLDNMYPEYIYIYDGASINAQCMLLTHFNPYEPWKGIFNAEVKPVVIAKNAIVAVRCTIMPGVTIGERAVVSAGMTIEKSVPDKHMVRGVSKIEKIDLSGLMK